MPDSGNLPSQRVSNTPKDKIPPKYTKKIKYPSPPKKREKKEINIDGVCKLLAHQEKLLGITLPIYDSPRLTMTILQNFAHHQVHL